MVARWPRAQGAASQDRTCDVAPGQPALPHPWAHSGQEQQPPEHPAGPQPGKPVVLSESRKDGEVPACWSQPRGLGRAQDQALMAPMVGPTWHCVGLETWLVPADKPASGGTNDWVHVPTPPQPRGCVSACSVVISPAFARACEPFLPCLCVLSRRCGDVEVILFFFFCVVIFNNE